MTFLLSQWLWLLLFFALYLLIRYRQNRAPLWSGKSMALVGAFVFGVLALARPVLPQKPVDIEWRGSDVIFAVDISRSMQAEDISPSRLEAAKKVLREVVTQDERDRFGVIAFTTNPIILSPLTRDGELLLHLFSGLDTSMVLTKGTHIGNALKLARKLSRSEHPIVVILTDGGDALGYSQESAWAKAQGLIVNVVMLATAAGSTLRTRDGSMLKNEEGGIVVTARNDAIRTLADATGGRVIEGPDAREMLDAIAAQAQRQNLSKTKVVLYRELYYYPLWISLFLAMLGMTDLTGRLRRRYA
jgi:Ca-activated chloride channel family protein